MKTFLFMLAFLVQMGSIEYSVEIRGAPVSDVLRLFAFVQNKNVLVPGDLPGTVTASFPRITLENALQTVLSSNELVGILKADVLEVRTRKMYEDSGENLITQTIPLKYARAKDVLAQSSSLISGTQGSHGSIVIDERINSVTVRGNSTQIDSVKKLLEGIDKPTKQIRIEARIVSATKTFSRSIGIQWGINGSVGPVTVGGINGLGSQSPQLNGRSINLNSPADAPLSGANLSMGPFGTTFIDAQLSMGEQNNQAKILSKPSIVTRDHASATMSSTLKYYVRTAGNLTISAGAGTGTSTSSSGSSSGGSSSGASAGGSGGTQMTGTLSEISAGITLVVTPHILPGNKISLDVSVTSSTPGAAIEGIPSIDDNTAKTTVTVDNGSTTVIGGLVRTSSTKDKTGIPILSKIPILNLFFGNSKDDKQDRELMIFISPTIVQDIS